MNNLGIYIHIPFCVRKCGYCDFFSGCFGETEKQQYFRDVLKEIGECPYDSADYEVTSVFFGGGTPSSVDPKYLEAIMEALKKRFRFAENPEISMEMNPGTVTGAEQMKRYREMGLNRLSIGLQSADNTLLKRIGRIHSYETFEETFRLAREAGFQNINVDLISGLPGDTAENFEKGLNRVLSLEPEHLSVYSLIIAENTDFERLYGPSGPERHLLPSEEEDRDLYARTGRILEDAGFERYEISNYAKKGFRCRHNVGYWSHVPYLGFGAAAASFMPDLKNPNRFLRFKNPERLSYIEGPYIDTETLGKDDLMREFMMIKLRMTEGVSEKEFRAHFDADLFEVFREEIRVSEAEGLLETVEFESKDIGNSENEENRGFENSMVRNRSVRLTSRGLDLANIVMERFL